MGKHLLRNDTECQNCGHTVEQKYCPNCGQKNTETRQSFHHLFTHFIEDLTHYDTAFWKTIKYLLLRPAKLTTEYLQGKRQTYVPPVKLYIFISFITFFIPALLPDVQPSIKHKSTNSLNIHPKERQRGDSELTERQIVAPSFHKDSLGFSVKNPVSYKSVEEMDSIEALKTDEFKLSALEYKLAKKYIEIYKHNTPQEVGNKFLSSFGHNLPKALFVYLPIFAFWLWLFHGKKRWFYFDHGIFALHYFAFILLNASLIYLSTYIDKLVDVKWYSGFTMFFCMFLLIWQIYYFFRAHRKMYHENFIINAIKSIILFIINIVSISFLLLLFAIITIYNLH